MHVFKHPKYYTELRKRNKSDQVISKSSHDGESERAPGPGLTIKTQATSSKPEAASGKQQARSLKPQALEGASDKQQALSNKPQV